MNLTTKVLKVTTEKGSLIVGLESGSIKMPVPSGSQIAVGDEIQVTISLKNQRKLIKGAQISGRFDRIVSKSSQTGATVAESAATPRRTDSDRK